MIPQRVLLIIPPLTQINTPYPSTAYLTGFLTARGYDVWQADLGIEMVLALFSRDGLSQVFARIRGIPEEDVPAAARPMLALQRAYLDTIEPVVRFLQGRDPTLGTRICSGAFLPKGPRSTDMSDDVGAFGTLGVSDHARYLATLYLEDIGDLVRETVAPQFGLSRYAESIGTSAGSFAPIADALDRPLSFTDELMAQALWHHMEATDPTVIGLSVPFPGNLYGALRIAQAVKCRHPAVRIVLGGGYANTELRQLNEPRLFDYVDYVSLDDGERPLLCVLEHLSGKRDEAELCRTFVRSHDRVVWRDGARETDFGQGELGTPTYRGLPMERYLSVLEMLNPMHRLWSDGRWNKLTVAHGCYWKQCTFCDVGLDYIGRYEASPSKLLVDRVEALIAETGQTGFHFVDEAAPPAGLKALALLLLERGLTISWWGNIRFEQAFTPDLCRLLAASGCIAVSGGLEVASDHVLERMKKGITVDHAARVAHAFKQAGIMVHAYLMYGFPGETIAETVESLERVRQMFAAGVIQSAFWHRFMATAHSPIGLDPASHGIRITPRTFEGFAHNDLTHEDPAGGNPSWVGEGLRKAVFNYMRGVGLEDDVRQWFDRRVPRPGIRCDATARALGRRARLDDPDGERRFVWIGGDPVAEPFGHDRRRLILPTCTHDEDLRLSSAHADWLLTLIRRATPVREQGGEAYPSLKDTRCQYPLGGPKAFDALLRTSAWKKTRHAGLLLV